MNETTTTRLNCYGSIEALLADAANSKDTMTLAYIFALKRQGHSDKDILSWFRAEEDN
jgi:hypothetical protein